MNILSYFAFLCLFAYVLMVDFQPSPSWCEYLIYLWLFSLVCEEMRQVLTAPHQGSVTTESHPSPWELGRTSGGRQPFLLAPPWSLAPKAWLPWLRLGFWIFPAQSTHGTPQFPVLPEAGSMRPKVPHLPNHILWPPLNRCVSPTLPSVSPWVLICKRLGMMESHECGYGSSLLAGCGGTHL